MREKDIEGQNLGRRVAKYTSLFSGLGFINTVVVAIFLVGGVIGIFAAIMWLVIMLRNDPKYIYIPVLVLCFAGMFAFVGAEQMYKAILNPRVMLYEGGVVYQTFKETHIVPWEQIVAVWQYRGIRSSRLIYTIQLRDQTRIKLDSASLRDLERLGNAIQKAVTQIKLPQYTEKLKTGSIIHFGRLNLSQSGISDGKQEIPWAEIQEVRFHAGYIRIRQVGKMLTWKHINGAEIANLPVFLALVDQIVGVQTGFSF